MEQDGIFKTTAFGGFDKQAVLAYIDKLTEQFHLSELEYQKQLEGFSKAQDSQLTYIHQLENQLSETEGKLEAVAAQLETERGTALSTQEMDAVRAKADTAEQKYHALTQELEAQRESNRQLQYKMESFAFKSKKYDELSVEVGDALLSARQNAEQITAQAQAEAAQLTSQAQADADCMLSQARTEAEKLISATKNRMARFEGELGSFKHDSGRLRKSIEEILFVLNDRVDIMQEIIAQLESRCNLDLKPPVSQNEPFAKPSDDAGLFGEVLYATNENT